MKDNKNLSVKYLTISVLWPRIFFSRAKNAGMIKHRKLSDMLILSLPTLHSHLCLKTRMYCILYIFAILSQKKKRNYTKCLKTRLSIIRGSYCIVEFAQTNVLMNLILKCEKKERKYYLIIQSLSISLVLVLGVCRILLSENSFLSVHSFDRHWWRCAGFYLIFF